MLKVFPFTSGSEISASYSLTSQYADSGSILSKAVSSSVADFVIAPTSGSEPDVNICVVTYAQYLLISGGTAVEDCTSSLLPYNRVESC